MKKLKKFLALALALFSCAILFTACGDDDSSSSEKSQTGTEQNGETATSVTTINALLEGKTGKVTVNISTISKIQTSASSTVTLGSSTLEEAVIDGGNDGAILEFKGAGESVLQVAQSATLIFKNLTLKDDTNFANQGYPSGYLKFGGNLRFENCKLYDGVALKDGANAVFENCEFTSSASNKYAAWVSAGSVTFKNCSFTGHRAIKIHEEFNTDIESVTVDDCRFTGLKTKPAVAIGSILSTDNTSISIKNCTITNCEPWDNVDSLEGIDGLYEADTLTASFTFAIENTTIDGVPSSELSPEFRD